MSRKAVLCGVTTLQLICGTGICSAADTTSATTEWNFSASLDGKPIGYHRFVLKRQNDESELHSEAQFNVKVLFINAYRYRHDAQEHWKGDCLSQLDANTDDNGRQTSVRGRQVDASFVAGAGGTDASLGGCVMSFAYWNPKMLQGTHLLNPQTGEYVPTTITFIAKESITARGIVQAAEHYRLLGNASIGGPMKIDLWYSADRQWLALESTTQDGRRLRYQLQ